jgi:hypothetical protein
MVAHLAERLTLHLGQEVAPELVADLVTRGLLPDPEVEDRSKAVLDLSVYGTLLTLAAGLDELIGAEKTDAVIEALGLIGEEPSLAEATKAAKRVPALAEVSEVRELSTEELVRRLQGG